MISALLVKELREKSGAGMMDAKKALLETGGDLEAAQDWLRTKGLLKAEKKSSRIAAEGLVGVRVQGDTGMIVELNSETDFVATNKEFIELVDLVLSEGFGITDKDDILKQLIEFTQYVYDQQTSALEGEAQKAAQNTEEAYGTWKPESN